ncbi:NAD(P)-binding protein [Streptomyces sp. NPDC050315]|uniref:NAD(P)-binding protein n=1 Tax=Streptomyces sp. NPDC050315 TaxID=3155039 RepID=UPI003429738A
MSHRDDRDHEDHEDHQDSYDVIVVGAGASGLAAAAALHAAGLDTVCLEARDRIGGRLLSAPASSPFPGGALDLGATWFWSGEERVRALAARSGIEVFDQYLAGDTVLQDATGTRRLPGNLIDVASRRFATGAQSLAAALAAALPTGALRLRPSGERRGWPVRRSAGPARSRRSTTCPGPAAGLPHSSDSRMPAPSARGSRKPSPPSSRSASDRPPSKAPLPPRSEPRGPNWQRPAPDPKGRHKGRREGRHQGLYGVRKPRKVTGVRVSKPSRS